jgi:hypothetical protein
MANRLPRWVSELGIPLHDPPDATTLLRALGVNTEMSVVRPLCEAQRALPEHSKGDEGKKEFRRE